jgi:hypothetical protein
MKRRDLLRQIKKAANSADRDWSFVREGANHEIWALDGKLVSIPRHSEINEYTAEEILKHFEEELGEGWWR